MNRRLTAQQERNADHDNAVSLIVKDVRRLSAVAAITVALAFTRYVSTFRFTEQAARAAANELGIGFLAIFEVWRASSRRPADVLVGYYLASGSEAAIAIARNVCGPAMGLQAFEPSVRLLDDESIIVEGYDGKTEMKTLARVTADTGVRQ